MIFSGKKFVKMANIFDVNKKELIHKKKKFFVEMPGE